MPVYGPTGGDFAMQAGQYLNQGLSNMGKNMTTRALFMEQQRQFNFQNIYKQISDMVSSENYGGDWTKFFSKNETMAKSFLATMYPGNPDMIDWVYQGLAKGNQSAQQQTMQAIEEQWKTINADKWEKQQKQQANQDMAGQGQTDFGALAQTVGLGQAGPGDFRGVMPSEAAPQGPTGERLSFDMPTIGEGAVAAPEPVSEAVGSSTYKAPEDIMFAQQATVEDKIPTLAMRRPNGRTVEERPKDDRAGIAKFAEAFMISANKVADFVKQRLPQSAQDKIDEFKDRASKATTQDELAAVHTDMVEYADKVGAGVTTGAISLNDLRVAGTNEFRRLGGVDDDTKSIEDPIKGAIGISPSLMKQAIGELQAGAIRNQEVLNFLNKSGMSADAVGLGQALQFMHSTVYGKPIPTQFDTNFGLKDAGINSNPEYKALQQMLGAQPTVSTAPAVEEAVSSGSVTSEEASVITAPAVTLQDVRHKQVIFGRLKRRLQGKVRRPDVSRPLRDAGKAVESQIAGLPYDALVKTAINSVPGNTLGEKMQGFFNAFMPQELIDERIRLEEIRVSDRNYEEAVRQFNAAHRLDVAKFSDYLKSSRLARSINGRKMHLEELAANMTLRLQEAQLKLMNAEPIAGVPKEVWDLSRISLQEMVKVETELLQQLGGDVEKFKDEKTKLYNTPGAYKSAVDAYALAMSAITGEEPKMITELVTRNFPGAGVIQAFGGQVGSVPMQMPTLDSFGLGQTSPTVTVQESSAVSDIVADYQ